MADKKIEWELIIAQLKGEISLSDKESFEAWMQRENSLSLYNAVELIWKDVTAKAAKCNPDIDRCWNNMKSRINI